MLQIHTVSVKNQRTYFASLVCIGLVVILFQCFLLKIVIVGTPRSKPENPIVHSVLYFNPPSHVDPQQWRFSTCRIPHCRFTTERRELNTSKAVIFHHTRMPDYPPPKPKDQKWIFTSKESPVYTHNTSLLREWNNKFNWIMSYRKDGDFYDGYGDLVQREHSINKNYSDIFSHKKLDVSWAVSNCKSHSQREVYVRELMKYIPVTVFGKCGNRYCGPKTDDENDPCLHVVSHNFKFYLAFENSLCEDYTSEKFYFIFLYDMPVIPVVRGALNGKIKLPRGTFIDTNDFKSPQLLAKYLKEVGDSSEEYIKLLKKKDEYVSRSMSEIFQSALCNLCERLHVDNSTSEAYDMKELYFTDQCKEPTDLSF